MRFAEKNCEQFSKVHNKPQLMGLTFYEALIDIFKQWEKTTVFFL